MDVPTNEVACNRMVENMKTTNAPSGQKAQTNPIRMDKYTDNCLPRATDFFVKTPAHEKSAKQNKLYKNKLRVICHWCNSVVSLSQSLETLSMVD